jgi:hypothetical protein
LVPVVFLGVARENETTTGRKKEDLLAPRFPPGITSGNSLDEDNSHTPRLDLAEPAEMRKACGVCRPSRAGVARHCGLVPIQPEPGPARGDHAVNRQQPFGQNGACNVQILEPGSRWREGHHMSARLDKSVV